MLSIRIDACICLPVTLPSVCAYQLLFLAIFTSNRVRPYRILCLRP